MEVYIWEDSFIPDLLFDVQDGIATLTLNRPEARNAFSLEMIRLWREALEEVRDNEAIRVMALTGNGKAFCAGGDVKSMLEGKGFMGGASEEDDFVTTGLKRKNSLWNHIQRIPLLMQEIDKPTLAAINGDAIGAGLDMALQCDLRYASDRARFAEGYVNLGLVPGDGGAYYLPRLIRLDLALELLWTGRMLDAVEAYEYGLVTRVIPHEQLLEETYRMAERLARGPQQAIRLTKRTVYQSMRTDLKTSLDLVSSFMGLVTELPDYREGLKAVAEKRKPRCE